VPQLVFHAGSLDDGAIGCQVAAQDHQTTLVGVGELRGVDAAIFLVGVQGLQTFSVENGSVVRTPPGAARYKLRASSSSLPPRISQSSNQSFASLYSAVWTFIFKWPERRSSPKMAGIPPARWTSSMCQTPLGATLDK